MDDQASSAQSREIVDLLIASPFAGALARNAPLLVVGGEPARLAYCNAAALELFEASGPAELSASVLDGDGQGARRIRHLAISPPEGAPRAELLRFFVGRRPFQIGLMCARLVNARGQTFLAASPAPLASRAVNNMALEDLQQSAAARTDDPGLATGRFVWSTDADDRFAAPSAFLLEQVGKNAPDAAETLDQLRARARGVDVEAFVGAIAGRTTFVSVRSRWLAADGKRTLVALLSGSPLNDRQRRFLGYRGFGIFTGEFAPVLEPAADVGAAHRPPVARSPASGAAALGERPTAASPIASPSVERSAEIVALRPALAVVPGHPNVVPIRPGSMRSLAVENSPRSGNSDSIALTTDERDAFREIALALGARVRLREERPATGPSASLTEPPTESAPRSHPADRPRDMIVLGHPPPAEIAAPSAASPPEPKVSDEAADARRLLDNLPVGAMVTRGEEPLYLNRTLLDLLGYRDLGEFGRAGGLARMFEGHEAERATPAGDGGPLSLVAANGELIAVTGRLQTLEWGGAPATLISLRRSLGAEYAARLATLDDEIRGLAARMLVALDAGSDGALAVDRGGRIQWVGRRAAALLGLEQMSALGENLTLLLAPESRAAAATYLASNWEASPGSRRASPVISTRDSQGREAHLSPMLVDAGEGEDRRAVILRDITASALSLRDAQTARSAAENASALKSDMLSAISHEIRTPLNAILGFAEVMRDERFGPIENDRYKQYVNDIHLSGGHVLSLVNDLLDLSKIEAGKFELDFAPLDANRIIQDCVAMMQPHAAQDRIIMRLSLFDKLPHLIADERSLRQIILNLMSNAVKFNEPGGQVIVSSVLNDAHQAVIRVRDTGIGMNESELAAALEPFRQVAGKRRVGGTGLGLPLTKALVEANKASFSINSRKEQGTLVELTFPIAHAAAAQ